MNIIFLHKAVFVYNKMFTNKMLRNVITNRIRQKKFFHKIADTTIRVNNKEVAKFKITFHNNNNLKFQVKNTTAGRYHEIKMPLNDYIFSTINDNNKDLGVVVEHNAVEDSFEVPLKNHLLEKYHTHGDKNKKVLKPDDPRICTFS